MRLNLTLLTLTFAFLFGIGYAAYGSGTGSSGINTYGTSNVSLNSYTMSVSPGGSASGLFNVTLASGVSQGDVRAVRASHARERQTDFGWSQR